MREAYTWLVSVNGSKVVRSARALGAGLLVRCEFRLASRIRRETTDQSVDVAQDPQIAHLVASKREDRRTVPPHVASGGCMAKHRLAMDTVEAQLSRDRVALLEEIEDIR